MSGVSVRVLKEGLDIGFGLVRGYFSGADALKMLMLSEIVYIKWTSSIKMFVPGQLSADRY